MINEKPFNAKVPESLQPGETSQDPQRLEGEEKPTLLTDNSQIYEQFLNKSNPQEAAHIREVINNAPIQPEAPPENKGVHAAVADLVRTVTAMKEDGDILLERDPSKKGSYTLGPDDPISDDVFRIIADRNGISKEALIAAYQSTQT